MNSRAVLAQPAGVLSRPLDDFTGIGWSLSRLLEGSGLAAIPPASFYVYGGVLRSLWSREKSRSLDIAFSDPAVRDDYLRSGARNASVARGIYASAEDLIAEADFTIGQVVYHAGCIYHSPSFFEHLAQRLLIPARLGTGSAIPTFLRVYKYVARGYGITVSELARIVSHIDSAELSLGLPYAAQVSDGVVLPG